MCHLGQVQSVSSSNYSHIQVAAVVIKTFVCTGTLDQTNKKHYLIVGVLSCSHKDKRHG